MENFERIKELVDELKKIVDEIHRRRPPQSEVGKKFRERLNDLEKKNKTAIEKIL